MLINLEEALKRAPHAKEREDRSKTARRSLDWGLMVSGAIKKSFQYDMKAVMELLEGFELGRGCFYGLEFCWQEKIDE